MPRIKFLVKQAFIFLIQIYRSFISVQLGPGCRFEPSCSCYAQQALKEHELVTAIRLIVGRLIRCRPGQDFGYDPVPFYPSRANSITLNIHQKGVSHE